MATSEPARNSAKVILACSVANALEWFDFIAFTMFATTIAKLYFPTGNELTSLLATFATFGVGFLMRPLGAIILGSYADRAGRKSALFLTIMLMAFGTAIIAFAPTYERIGLWAPILIVAARLIQGLSAGGQIGGTISLLMEHAPENKRGQFVAWQQASVGAFYLLAGAIGYLIARLLSPAEIDAWGWRLPFYFGLSIAFVGLYIRAQLPETALFKLQKQSPKASPPLKELLKGQLGALAIGVGIVMVWTVCTYIANYMPTYTVRELKMPATSAFLGFVIIGTVSLASPAVGAWSDRIGRRPLMFAAAAAILVLLYPAFHLLTQVPTTQTLLAIQLALTILVTLYAVPASASLAELFPTRCRATGVALSYSLSVTLFGGFTPTLCAWIVAHTADKAAIAYYPMLAAAVSLVALMFLRDRSKLLLE